MKSLMIAAAAATVGMIALPALADPLAGAASNSGISGYGTLGYTNLDGDNADLSAVTARLGARLGPYFGVEGEVSGGLGHDHVDVAGDPVRVRLDNQYAGYAVGFLPILPNADLFARIGYGATRLNASGPGVAASGSLDSLNYGVGGQYLFDGHNGLRADYTRYDYDRSGVDANVWSIAYIRKF